MAKDINKDVFDDATKLKLSIFGECFEEWLPVFMNDLYTEKVFILDFFAGSGMDSNNNHGSPLVLLNKAKGEDRKYCVKARKEIQFIFNEALKGKSNDLASNVENYIETCATNNECSECIYSYDVQNSEFKSFFQKHL